MALAIKGLGLFVVDGRGSRLLEHLEHTKSLTDWQGFPSTVVVGI